MEVVGAVENGIEAIERVKLLKPDVLILDIHMPGCSGLEVLRTIRTEKNKCVIIIFTKLADEFYRKKCRELRADYFFDKLSEFEQFLNLLNTM